MPQVRFVVIFAAGLCFAGTGCLAISGSAGEAMSKCGQLETRISDLEARVSSLEGPSGGGGNGRANIGGPVFDNR